MRFAYEYPELGQAAVASRLQQTGLKISPSGVRYLWQKHGLETAAKRLKALAADGKSDQLSANQQKRLDRTLLTDDLRGKEVIAGVCEGGRRSILLNTAAELFAEKGFDRTAMPACCPVRFIITLLPKPGYSWQFIRKVLAQ